MASSAYFGRTDPDDQALDHVYLSIFRTLFATVFLLFAATHSQAQAANLIRLPPTSPLDPDLADCQALNQEFNDQISVILTAASECLRTTRPEPFGYEMECHIDNSGVWSLKNGMHAWPQCLTNEAQECNLRNGQKRELAICRERANAKRTRIASEEERFRQQQAEELRNANDKYEQAYSGIQLLQNPSKFLAKSLSGNTSALDSLFGKQRNEFNADLGQEVYRYSMNQSLAGTGTMSNKLAGILTRQALNRLGQIHTDTLQQFDSAMSQAIKLEAEIKARPYRPPAVAPMPSATQRSSAPRSEDCLYNEERLAMYKQTCAGVDGCRLEAQMLDIVSQSCP